MANIEVTSIHTGLCFLLQRIVNTAGRIIGAQLPSLKDIHPPPPPKRDHDGERRQPPGAVCSASCPLGEGIGASVSTRLTNSLIHQAVRKLNSLPSLPSVTSTSCQNAAPPPPFYPSPPKQTETAAITDTFFALPQLK